jgi:hypothetical protein
MDAISPLPLLLALLFPPAGGVSQTGDDSQQNRTVSGQVVNSVTGQPIAGALVQIGGEHAMLTDHEGQFEFHDLAGAHWGAAATKPGYLSLSGLPAFVDLSIPAHEVQGAITLKLVPEAIIFGKALDPSSQPLQGLHVQLKRMEVRDGLRRWQEVQSTTTSVEGEFRFFELEAGKYSLSTSFQIDGQQDQASAVAFSPVVYPPLNSTSSSGNEGLSITAGEHVEANLNPPSQTLHPVTGHIEGPAVQGVVFEAESGNGEIIRPVVRFTRLSGNFRLLLPSGSYHLKVRAFFQGERLFAAREISLGEAPLKNISITPAPLATVPVEIEYQAGGASSPETQPPPPYVANIGLEETGPSTLGSTFYPQPPQPSNSPGDSLAIGGLEPGEYRLVARPPPPWYLASAVCGALDLRREPMTIAGGAAGCTIHAVLHNDSATLNWTVNTKSQGSSGKQIFVYALALDNFIQSMNMASAQEQGSGDVQEGSLEGLAPGRYLVMALDHAEELPYREPDLMQRYLSEGKEVTLAAKAKSEVQLDVVAGEP